jgi:hypothetical protein
LPQENSDVVGDVGKLKKRLNLLEMKVKHDKSDAPVERALTSTYAAGAVALFLSMALPWVRSGGGLRFSEEGMISGRSLDVYATGWLLFGEAVGEGQWLFILTFVVLLALLCFSLICLHGAAKGALVTTTTLSILTPVLYFVAWFPSLSDKSMSAGSGVFVMVVACAMIGLSANKEVTESRYRP